MRVKIVLNLDVLIIVPKMEFVMGKLVFVNVQMDGWEKIVVFIHAQMTVLTMESVIIHLVSANVIIGGLENNVISVFV